MVVDFFLNFLYWGLAYFVAYRFIFKEPDPLGRRLFFVFMLALLTTGSVNFRNIRAMVKR